MIKIEKEKCCGCSACEQACPQNCIVMEMDQEGFFYPNVNHTRCIDCKICERVCPFLSEHKNTEFKPQIVGAKANDDKVRYWSSSGGIFTLIAEKIIDDGGVVFGAEMSEDCSYVRHVVVNDKENLYKLRGSKYIQSRINNTYSVIQTYLREGKRVLFTGTPCQISGLRLFLKKDYEDLFCVDIICHGVPSEKLWNSYLSHIERKYRKKIKSVAFRSKKYSWGNFGFNLSFDKKSVFKYSFEDPFFRMFNSSYSMRPSCYECKSKGSRTLADMSIGDFWGIDKVFPDFNDDKGVSIVLVNTAKGKYLFEQIKDRMSLTDDFIEYDTAITYNPPIEFSIEKSSMRTSFYEDVLRLSFHELEKKYTPMGPRRKWKAIKMKLQNRMNISGGYGVMIEFK